MVLVRTKNEAVSKRPYTLGERLKNSEHKRAVILKAARSQLESNGFLRFTMDSLARESGVTRQTVHNLFGTKTGVLEALFDQLALDGGMEGMRIVMQQTDAESMLAGFVAVFTGFWAKDRLLLRRIHGIAAIDPELSAVVDARNRRRRFAAERVVDQRRRTREGEAANRAQQIATLCALTSFEFFDALAEVYGQAGNVAELVLRTVEKALSAAS